MWRDQSIGTKVAIVVSALLFGAAHVTAMFLASTEGRIVATVVVAGAFLVLWRRAGWRPAFAPEFLTVTASGVRLYGSKRVLARWTAGRSADAEIAIADALRFWGDAYPKQSATMVELFRGATIQITEKPLKWGDLEVNGMQDDAGILVRWRDDQDTTALMNLIRHELGHLALRAVRPSGDANERDHREFLERGYGA